MTHSHDFVLAEQTHHFIRSEKWDAAVLPFGATEPHNFHMPYGTDNFQVEEVGRRACARAYERGAKVLLLPTMPFGVNTNHLKVKGALALSVTPTTLLKLITDLVDALERQGLKKLVLLNGHGGNELKPLSRELHHRTGVFICVCDWYRVAADLYPTLFKAPGEHADEMETSMGLAYFPHLMRMSQAGPGTMHKTKFDAINKGWVSITRPWHLLTDDTGAGDPSAATPEKAQKLIETVTQRLGDFLYDLATTPMDESFPFVR
ncbi:MAG TPA: creatininase family protein [Tepidisphaeraceae bacterium]|jgi:creatinine amidohydrolase